MRRAGPGRQGEIPFPRGKYPLTRSVNLWSVEDNEYVFIYADDHLDQEGLEHAIQMSMMFMLAATLTSLLFTMGGRIGDLASGFDGVAAAQLVISAPLFVLAVFLMVEGLRTLNAQRRARLSEGA